MSLEGRNRESRHTRQEAAAQHGAYQLIARRIFTHHLEDYMKVGEKNGSILELSTSFSIDEEKLDPVILNQWN